MKNLFPNLLEYVVQLFKTKLIRIAISKHDLFCQSKIFRLKENSKPWIDSETIFAFCKRVTFLGNAINLLRQKPFSIGKNGSLLLI